MRRFGTVGVAGVLLVGLTGCSSGSITFEGSFKPTTHAAATSSAGSGLTPSVRRALPKIEAFVEHERGLKFKHPVKVKLLGPKAFVKLLDKDNKPPSRSSINKQESVFASLGLVSPGVDLYKAFKAASDESTIGFYKFTNKRLYVKGKRATPGVRAVMSHELTHALTDQRFGLRRPELSKDNQERQAAFTALSEGDAERTRMAYESQVLTPAQRQIAEQQEAGAGGAPPGVPQVVLELIGFPYEIGPRFVDELVADGGINALNRAYRHPPVSSEQLLNPRAYLDHDKPKHVAAPPADHRRLNHGDLGVIGLLLMFEHGGVPSSTAFSALRSWGGDQFASWQAGKRRWCLRDTVVMDDASAMGAFRSALSQWISRRGGKAKIEKTAENKTTFVTCS
ncbi:MAG TPA: hypothetical protein VHD81_00495 [Mycobacteriales bacterium]|nr:hypothetical protein [Mycobacteriales bacterium]